MASILQTTSTLHAPADLSANAGDGSSTYARWPRLLPPSVELLAPQLPGREGCIRERPHTDGASVILELAERLTPYLAKPFVIFGHSMGGLLAFELTRELRRRGLRMPARLLVSGAAAPQEPRPKPLDRPQFIDELPASRARPRRFCATLS